MIAPCGYGKSLVFVFSALQRKGVHIVVEPLNAIIKSQLRDLSSFAQVIHIEQLLNEEDAKCQRSHRASDRLQEILNDIKTNRLGKPVLLFTTPELIATCMPQLEALSMVMSLKNITIDEVDMIQQSHASFRGVYTEILGNLRGHCQGTKFVFLSATVTATGLAGLLRPTASIHDEKPVLYLNDRALADSLSFEVERKSDDEQVR
jgi:superfamily II DNA helicase RecQ